MVPRYWLLVVVVFAFCAVALSGTTASQPSLTAEEIVQKNVAARGGLQTWRGVQTLLYSGKMQAGGDHRTVISPSTKKRGIEVPRLETTKQVELPFTLELKRPRKQRLEIEFNGQVALQVYDGVNGYKLRPYLNRRVVETYTVDEAKVAAAQADLDGPLVDYAAKGTKIEFAGTEKVDDHDTYKLKLTPRIGEPFLVWIDARTFLETKMEGTPRRLDGQYHPVEIYLSDYRTVNGIVLPYLIETKVLPVKGGPMVGVPVFKEVTEKISIEQVQVNPQLPDPLFARPSSDAGLSAANPRPSDGSLKR